MSDRRRLLMTCLNTGKWLPYSYEYLYYDLIPTVISGKNVKNKAKVATIYGNSVVENQLIQNGNFADSSAWGIYNGDTTYSISNNEIWFTASQTISSWSDGGYVSQSKTLLANHKYLITCEVYTEQAGNCGFYYGGAYDAYLNVVANQWQRLSSIRTQSSNITDACQLSPFFTVNMTQGQKHAFRNFMLIDLTLMFGTGNEPTTLTDNRIQALLNRGYIAYNTGTIKSVDIGEIVTYGCNIFDQQLSQGGLDSSNGSETNSSKRCKTDYIELFNNSIWFDIKSSTYNFKLVCFYDNNYNYISYEELSNKTLPYNKTVPANTKYIRITVKRIDEGDCSPSDFDNVNIYVGYINDYAPHTTPQTLPLKYQGNGAINAHDSLEITNSGYVFTKNIGSVDMGTLSFSYTSSMFVSDIGNIKTQPNDICVNAICKRFTAISRTDFNNSSSDLVMRVDNSQNTPYMYFRDFSYTSGADFKTAMSGTYLYYELATPQVITIPRKHLGVVDLGSLTGYVSNDKYFISAEYLGISTPSSNNNGYGCYCKDYMVDSGYNVYTKVQDKTMCLTSPYIGGNFIIYDSSFVGKTANEIKALLSGTLLFYETENEVADILTQIDIEAGGTITSAIYSWNQNQLADVKPGSAVLITGVPPIGSGAVSISVDSDYNFHFDGVVSLGTSSYTTFDSFFNNHLFTFEFGHKYYIKSLNVPATLNARTSDGTTNTELLPINTERGIVEWGGHEIDENCHVYWAISSGTFNATGKFFIVDLTKGYGYGKEPTSLDDPRIAEIDALGFPPYDPDGSLGIVDPKALPNLDLSVKTK